MIKDTQKKILRLEAEKAEKIGRLTERQLDIIYENKWFHLLVPKDYGGMEMDLPSFALFMEELATVDGAFAWNVNLGAGANMFAGYMDKGTAKEIFADPKTCIAGSGALTGIVKRVDHHFVLDGFWKYASGSAHANYFSLNAIIEPGDGQQFISFIVPVAEVEVVESWKTSGLKATASHDFKVRACAVPQTFSFDLLKPSIENEGILYRFSFKILAEINMLVMSTGLAIRFLELVKEIAGQKKTGAILLCDHPGFKRVLEKQEAAFLKAREVVFASLSFLWNKREQGLDLTLEESEAFTQEVLLCAEFARLSVDALSPFMGMHLVFETSELNRVWRDFKTASQHALLSPLRLSAEIDPRLI